VRGLVVRPRAQAERGASESLVQGESEDVACQSSRRTRSTDSYACWTVSPSATTVLGRAAAHPFLLNLRTQSRQREVCEHVNFLRANNESRRRDKQAAAGRRGGGNKWSWNELLGSQTTRTHTRGLTKADLLALSWQRRWIPYSSRTRPWSSTSEVQQKSSSRCVCFIAGLTSSPFHLPPHCPKPTPCFP
jgi:hypothetical protein